MFREYAGALGQVVTSAFKRESDNGLVRMFRVEYYKEYLNAIRMGANIDEKFVKTFLADAKAINK